MISVSSDNFVIIVLLILSIVLALSGSGDTLKGSLTHNKSLENRGCLSFLIGVIIFMVCISWLF